MSNWAPLTGWERLLCNDGIQDRYLMDTDLLRDRLERIQQQREDNRVNLIQLEDGWY